jgi:hypothetical protein
MLGEFFNRDPDRASDGHDTLFNPDGPTQMHVRIADLHASAVFIH